MGKQGQGQGHSQSTRRSSEPAYGQLPGGVTSELLENAIARSGYPLQASVAEILRTSFVNLETRTTTQEEWAYIDSDSGQVRSIDVFAEVPLEEHMSELRPYLNVLIECKQSEMPYVLFLRGESPSDTYDFPEFGGLANASILLYSEQDDHPVGPSCSMSIHDVFYISNIRFFEFPCPFAISISKAAFRRGDQSIELTGEDAYRSITLPLLKAADHIKEMSKPLPDHKPSVFRIIICLAVIRAPMFGVIFGKGRQEVVPLPWARACRLEPGYSTASNVRYYDIVHEDYLADYLAQLISAITAFESRTRGAKRVIREGRGVGDLGEEFYQRMRAFGTDEQIPEDDGSGLNATYRGLILFAGVTVGVGGWLG
jgi:hypothetical protein